LPDRESAFSGSLQAGSRDRYGAALVTARLILVLVIAVAALAAPASASTLVYQCGAAVCAIDPDLGGSARQLTPNGRLAGLTRDGVTASWVEPSGNLVQVPVAGGPAQTVFTGEVVTQPSMSPDGARYMWSYPGPDGFGGLNAIWINRLTVAGSKLEGVSFCSFCTTTHGWLNTMSIAAFPANENGAPSKVCRIASKEEVPGESNSCVQTLVAAARGGIGFPNGNAAGTKFVAVLSPGERTGVRGRIVRYALPAGTPIGDLTAGTTDTTPIFSPDGDRVAFERDGQIVVKDLAGGAERVIGPGVYPF
jgi:WD40-like Beta Propeller Repeat